MQKNLGSRSCQFSTHNSSVLSSADMAFFLLDLWKTTLPMCSCVLGHTELVECWEINTSRSIIFYIKISM